MIGRSWTEISLDTIKKNYLTYMDGMPDGQKIMAVVKADAYGHGDVKVALMLQKEGCENFAVSNFEEAKKLRISGVMGQILILGYTPVDLAQDLAKYDITQALISTEYAQDLFVRAELSGVDAKSIKTQFAIDTGMNRIGLDADDEVPCESAIRQYAEIFNMTGIFTHLAVADMPEEDVFTNAQISKFEKIAERVKDLELPYVHCNNTAAGLWHNTFGNLTRLGISLYGLKPDYNNTLPADIKPALTWKSVIAMVKDVRPGETVGYGRTYKIDRPRRVATIPTGYADGYSRHLSSVGMVVVNGQKAPVAGRVCMDQIMIDITDVPEVTAGMEVELIGPDYGADEMAHDIGTIGYEIVCDISARVERTYI